MQNLLDEGLAVPVIMGLVETIKHIGLPSKYSALLSCIFGLLYGIFISGVDSIEQGIVLGLVNGLAASGLYSGSKRAVETMRARRIRQ